MALTVQLALFTALLFIIVSSQPLYKVTTKAFAPLGLRLADSAGNPTRAGLVVHALVFFGLVYGYCRVNRV